MDTPNVIKDGHRSPAVLREAVDLLLDVRKYCPCQVLHSVDIWALVLEGKESAIYNIYMLETK